MWPSYQHHHVRTTRTLLNSMSIELQPNVQSRSVTATAIPSTAMFSSPSSQWKVQSNAAKSYRGSRIILVMISQLGTKVRFEFLPSDWGRRVVHDGEGWTEWTGRYMAGRGPRPLMYPVIKGQWPAMFSSPSIQQTLQLNPAKKLERSGRHKCGGFKFTIRDKNEK
jgi:hypothetical protein